MPGDGLSGAIPNVEKLKAPQAPMKNDPCPMAPAPFHVMNNDEAQKEGWNDLNGGLAKHSIP